MACCSLLNLQNPRLSDDYLSEFDDKNQKSFLRR